MEIKLHREDLRNVNCGGGMREFSVVITIDSSKSLKEQKAALLYEVLACYLEPQCPNEAVHDFVEDLADKLVNLLEELESSEKDKIQSSGPNYSSYEWIPFHGTWVEDEPKLYTIEPKLGTTDIVGCADL